MHVSSMANTEWQSFANSVLFSEYDSSLYGKKSGCILKIRGRVYFTTYLGFKLPTAYIQTV